MSYNTQQTSQYQGSPALYIKFIAGPTVWALTNQATSKLIGADEYLPIEISIDKLEQSLAESEQGLQITIPSSSAVATQFKAYLPTAPIVVRIFCLHRTDADEQLLPEFVGETASCTYGEDGLATIQCFPVMRKTERTVPWCVYSATCNHALFGPGCGVIKELHEVSGIAQSVGISSLIVPQMALQPDGWATAGFVVRVATNEHRWITSHTGTGLTLTAPFLGMQAGESVKVYAGCDGLESTCKDKFNNLPNFWGFPDSPDRNPFTDGLLGQGSAVGGGNGGGGNGGIGNTGQG